MRVSISKPNPPPQLYDTIKSRAAARVVTVCRDSKMEQESFLCGGVALFHTMADGKHCYEVGDVLTSKPCDFGRKGDKLMMINDVETQHLPPPKIVRMLSSGSPLLTMHRASIDEAEGECLDSESMRPYRKERTTLDFGLAMVRETCLDKDEENPQEECEWESSHTEGNYFNEEEILLLSMTNTSVAVVEARGCDEKNPCGSCGATGCAFSKYVVATEQCKVTAYRQYIRKSFEKSHILIQSLLQQSICPEKIPRSKSGISHMGDSSAANITIYYYMTNAEGDFDKGAPVVLNFSGSTNFLKCIYKNGRPRLTIECCDKSRLQSICMDDLNTWSFVFYLKTTKDNHRRFESAAYSGWFIHTKPSGLVCVDQGTDYYESNFYVVIHVGKL